MRQVTWVSGSFPAHVLAARLQSEGIDCELRGAVDSPYGLTVGAMARVDVYVPEDQMEDAQLVMLVGEVDATLAAPGEWAHAGEERRPRRSGPCGRRSCCSQRPVSRRSPCGSRSAS